MLRLDLLQQLGAHEAAAAHHRRRQHRARQREGLVDGAQAARGVVAVHNHRDLTLGGALGDGAHVAPDTGEGAHEGGAHAGGVRHALPDDGDDRHPLEERDGVDGGAAQLQLEGLLHRPLRLLPLLLGHGDADGVLRRGLRDHDDVDVARGHGAHEAPRHARHPDDARPLQVHKRHLVDGRDAFDRHGHVPSPHPLGLDGDVMRVVLGQAVASALDDGALEGGVEDVADEDRDGGVDAGHHGRGVQHLGAEVGELDGLVVLERRDGEGLRHPPRVRREHPVCVLPHCDAGGAQEAREDGCGEVGAAALEGGGRAVGR
mmetsp:Transcript_39052/g.103231  ORF Transcript_39052/g.103231 Transcript_39052/m.103231 type:complete len:317 (-) Transcript_39052:950-1900(-)